MWTHPSLARQMPYAGVTAIPYEEDACDPAARAPARQPGTWPSATGPVVSSDETLT